MDRVTDQVKPWIEDAINAHTLGAQGRWEIGFAVAPTPAGPQAMLVLYLEIPSPVLGQKIGTVGHFPAESNQEHITAVVKAMMGALTERKAAELSTTNGHGAAPGKLHLP